MTDAPDRAAVIRPDYPEPLWIQAVNLINDEIASGALTPGMRLPPERQLCIQLGISRVTLRKALTRLVDEGVLSASHGRGWYVAVQGGADAAPGAAAAKDWPNSLESFTETAQRMGLTASSRVLRAEILPASFDEAEELSIAPGTPIFHLERVRLLNGVPIAIDRSRVPAELVPDFPTTDFTVASVYDKLAEAGLELARADSTIEAREADAYIATNLDIGEGKPVLAMHQIVVDHSDRALLASTIQYSGERYRLRTHFSRLGRPKN